MRRLVPPGAVIRGSAAAAIVALLLASCTSPSASEPSSSPQPAGPVNFKLMEFNIEYGGTLVDFDKVSEAVRASGADVVGLEEGYGHTQRLADALGWKYTDPSLQIVSRLPLIQTPDMRGIATYVVVAPGLVVAMGNVHLPSAPYGPNQVRKGATAEDVLALEDRVRVPAVQPSLDALAPMVTAGMPTFLIGDFNAPSHLDWTDAAVGLRPQVTYPLDWPVSEAVEQAGFVDSYRALYPDPVAIPGITWPAARPDVRGWDPGPNAPNDRIDLVYAAGPATPTQSQIVGEEGGDGVDIAVSPWPSDHRGIVSTFEVSPVPPPVLVAASPSLVDAGDEVQLTVHTPGQGGERVAVVASGAAPADGPLVDEPASGTDGAVTVSTQGWTPGAYDAVLTSADGSEVARSPVWVRAPGAEPVVETVEKTYAEGNPIEVAFHFAPGNRWDWLGIYRRGADPKVAYYIMWTYTGSAIDGTATFDENAHGPWPLKPGTYSVYLLRDDTYAKLASGDFVVKG